MNTDYNDCPVCLGSHDDEIHAATLRVHAWLRTDINRRIAPWLDLESSPLSNVEAA